MREVEKACRVAGLALAGGVHGARAPKGATKNGLRVLIAAGPHCYFQYTWGWGADCGTYDWYPEFDKPLGAPKATRYGTASNTRASSSTLRCLWT